MSLYDRSSQFTTSHRIVLGDVHGQYDALVELLAFTSPGKSDQIYFLGDLVDRGLGSRQVVDLVRTEGYTTLIGNHEQMMIDSFLPTGKVSSYDLHSWLANGGDATFESYKANLEDLWEDVQWLKQQPYFLDLDDIWLVHAGLNPTLPLEEQIPEDMCWIRDPFHTIEKPYFEKKLILTGHTITFTFPNVEPGELVRGEGWLDIDTGAYHPKSGWLTAIDLDGWQVYQYNTQTKEKRTTGYADLVRSYSPRKRMAESPSIWPFWFKGTP